MAKKCKSHPNFRRKARVPRKKATGVGFDSCFSVTDQLGVCCQQLFHATNVFCASRDEGSFPNKPGEKPSNRRLIFCSSAFRGAVELLRIGEQLSTMRLRQRFGRASRLCKLPSMLRSNLPQRERFTGSERGESHPRVLEGSSARLVTLARLQKV